VVALALSYAVATAAVVPSVAGAVQLPPGGLVASTPNFGGANGSFSVTDDGAATYALPLWVPEGRRGSHVDLSLSYNSRAGNGLLGVGWRLDGLSSITVCPRTPSLDGFTSKLFYDGSDGLCLGGDRLLPLARDLPQIDYTTERATFARITAFGMEDNVPDYFKVWSKDGRIMTFGQTADSRLDAFRLHAAPNGNVEPEFATRSPAAWAVNKIEDRDGNVSTVEYARSEDGASGLWSVDMRPSVIRYEPNRSVRFFYENRFSFTTSPQFFDVIDGYAGGIHTRTDQRLSRIVMSGGPAGGTADPLREYRLSYQNASITGRSQLTTVTECDGRASAGAADGACKTPLTFTWSQGSPDFTPIDLTDVTDAGTSPNGHGGNRILPVDIDGDGRDDLLYTDADNNWKLRRSTGTGFGPPTDAGIARAGTDTESLIKLVDFDLDGRTDAMAEVPDSSRGGTGWQLFRSDGTKFVPYVDNIGFFGNDDDLPDQVHFLDLDGNGTPDFLTAADEINPNAPGRIDGPWRYRLNTGTEDGHRFQPEVQMEGSGEFFPQSSTKLAVVDTNGDGRQELIGPTADGKPGDVGLNALGGSESVPTNLRGDDPLLGDFNGDGLVDGQFVIRVASPSVLQPNTGNGVQGFDGQGAQDPGRVGDFNGDGRDDVLMLPFGCAHDCHGTLYLSGGDRQQDIDVGDTVTGNGFAPTQPLDVDGDGMLDLISVQDFAGGHGFLRLLKHAGGAPDHLVRIDPGAGIGPSVEVEYTTLADRSVHTPCQGVYPQTCPKQGGVLVSAHQIATGAANTPWDRFTHTYTAARADLQGRGCLGFAEHTVQRVLTG